MSNQPAVEKANPKRKLFFGLFIFPLLIAVGMAALLCAVVFLTHEEETPETLITAIKSGPPSKRWQKAFELSNELNAKRGMIRGSGVRREIAHILNDPVHYDAKTRSYMALALSRFEEPETVEILRRRLQEEEPEVQIHLMWALGNLDAKEAAGDIERFLVSENQDLRKVAAYVLGVLGDKNYVPDLKPLLQDPVPDVSWNAALSLARLGDGSGRDVLMKMLDRSVLASHYSMPKEQIEKVMVNAIKGLAQIQDKESLSLLRTLSTTDESLKVRQAALEALKQIKA